MWLQLAVDFIVLCIFICANLKAWSNMWKDKDAAIANHWRISERELLCDALFGWPCGLIAMRMSRHKVQKPEFLRRYRYCCRLGVVIYIIIVCLLFVLHRFV